MSLDCFALRYQKGFRQYCIQPPGVIKMKMIICLASSYDPHYFTVKYAEDICVLRRHIFQTTITTVDVQLQKKRFNIL